MFLVLAIASTGLHWLCTYGRVSRQLVPFLCLTTASALSLLRRASWFRRTEGVWALALVIQAGLNLRQPFAQRFPGDVLKEVLADYDRVGTDLTVEGPYGGKHLHRRWILLNTRYLAPIWGLKAAPEGVTVYRVPHPLEYVPYQYESLTPRERSLLPFADISIRLIDTRTHGASGP